MNIDDDEDDGYFIYLLSCLFINKKINRSIHIIDSLSSWNPNIPHEYIKTSHYGTIYPDIAYDTKHTHTHTQHTHNTHTHTHTHTVYSYR